jgi:hypothetical protein
MNDAKFYEMQVQIWKPNTWGVTPGLGDGDLVAAAAAAGRQRQKSARSRRAPPPSSPMVPDLGGGSRGRRQWRLDPSLSRPMAVARGHAQMQRGGRPASPRSSNGRSGGGCGHDDGRLDWARRQAPLGLLVFLFF